MAAVTDMPRAVAFYGDTLGLDVTEHDDDWSEVDANGLKISLNGSAESPRATAARYRLPARGGSRTSRPPQGVGVEFSAPLSEHPWGRIAPFKDPRRQRPAAVRAARLKRARAGKARAMRFRPGARLDTGQVQDRRGVGGRGLAVGGGVGGLLIVVVLALLGVNLPTGSDPFSLGTSSSDEPTTDLSATCRTGSDANQREDCRIVAVVNSVQEYWSDTLDGYREAPTRFFSGQTSTGCGGATSAVGPFYCPADQTVYIDLSFYDELRSRFGARAGRSPRPT